MLLQWLLLALVVLRLSNLNRPPQTLLPGATFEDYLCFCFFPYVHVMPS
jgi:hypothetical protein